MQPRATTRAQHRGAFLRSSAYGEADPRVGGQVDTHEHGASPTTAMMHIAIQESLDGTAIEWMGTVSDEQYEG